VSDPNVPDPVPVTDPPKDDGSAPGWAKNLIQKLDELPGKINAAITDDDKDGIAEKVHGLFERSGAFVDPDKDKPEPPNPDDPPADAQPEKKQGLRGFASKFEGGRS
jgi:hypothetical protein